MYAYKQNYHFLGWSRDPNASVPEYRVETDISKENGSASNAYSYILDDIVLDETCDNTPCPAGTTHVIDLYPVFEVRYILTYLGTEKYPKIIEETTHTDLQEIRSHKNRQKAIDRASAIYKLSFPVICGKCGSVMRRKQDMRRNYLQKWTCTDSACAESVKINDEKLLQGITGILNELIAAPEQITCPNVHEAEADAKLLRLENEIGRTLEGCDFDRDALRERLLQRAALKYAKIGNEQHVFRTLTRLIQNAEHQTAFPSELANKVIRQISLKNSQEILVTLINGQELGREVADT